MPTLHLKAGGNPRPAPDKPIRVGVAHAATCHPKLVPIFMKKMSIYSVLDREKQRFRHKRTNL